MGGGGKKEKKTLDDAYQTLGRISASVAQLKTGTAANGSHSCRVADDTQER
jgi:hypothetical protein